MKWPLTAPEAVSADTAAWRQLPCGEESCSWVTSVANMEKLVDFLARKKIHPNEIITHRFALKDAEEAYRVFATGKTGKVCVNMELE